LIPNVGWFSLESFLCSRRPRFTPDGEASFSPPFGFLFFPRCPLFALSPVSPGFPPLLCAPFRGTPPPSLDVAFPIFFIPQLFFFPSRRTFGFKRGFFLILQCLFLPTWRLCDPFLPLPRSALTDRAGRLPPLFRFSFLPSCVCPLSEIPPGPLSTLVQIFLDRFL